MEQKDYEAIYKEYKQQSREQAYREAETGINPDGEEFIAVKKNGEGDIIAFKTNTGRELDYVTALNEVKTGKIAHVDIFHKYGRDIIRSEPDGIKENNLDHLPEF